MTKVVSSADVDFVATVLHPEEPEWDDIEIERQLVDDPDVQLNRFFHKGTSNTTEMRRAFVKTRKTAGKEVAHVDPEELNGLLQLLNVSPITTKSTMEERKLVQDLLKKIEEDLIKEQREKELMMIRKGGFWRWASKKAYRRLLQHGRIWSEKDNSENQSSKNDGTASSSSAVGGAEQEPTETDSEGEPSEDSISDTLKNFKLDTAPTKFQSRTPRKINAENDGWTTVGKAATPKATPKTQVGNLKLVRNDGLARLANKSSPGAHGFYSSMLGRDKEA